MRTKNYIGTFKNNLIGNLAVMSLRRGLRQYCKNNGLKIVVYGRGPRKEIFKKRSLDPKNWEYGKQWSSHYNHHYRPKLADSTHFDVYFASK